MEIQLNGKPCTVQAPCSAAELLSARGYKGKTTIWVNGIQLLLSEYESHQLKEADQVKILRIIGGG
jgi:thiamine biosynthesis protein ThiS